MVIENLDDRKKKKLGIRNEVVFSNYSLFMKRYLNLNVSFYEFYII